ncbi:c-type cytochrome domain-containing protein [Prosthecobacter sp.]|uniref:c-type cytochrome domain-containing protein n=1 Tax=Prosthecobacter sp. TaxID=1965333 RepID=UPI003783D606
MHLFRLSSLLCVLALASCTTPPDSETKPLGENVLSKDAIHAAKHGPVDFVVHVKPVLEAKCVMCHNRKALPGHISLENRREALRTKALGTVIVPGHPETSLLVANVKTVHQKVSVMPAVGERLTQDEYTILTKWVKEGAQWPEGKAGTLKIIR